MFSETMVSLVWYRLNKSEDLPSHQPSKNNLLFRMVVRYRTYIIYYGAVQLYHTNLIPVSYSAVMRSRDDDACLVPFMLFECMSSSCYQCVIANIFVLFSSFQSPRFKYLISLSKSCCYLYSNVGMHGQGLSFPAK